MNEKYWEELSKDISESSLKKMHGKIKECLDMEDAGQTDQYGVRAHPDWKKQADIFEKAMSNRGIDFTPIKW